MRAAKKASEWIGVAMAMLILAANPWDAEAATATSQGASDWNAKGWKLAIHDDDYREEAKIFGDEAFQDDAGLFQIKKVHMETYAFDGAGGSLRTNLIIDGATCQWNLETRVANSSDVIVARTADGKFTTTGKGFQWSQDTGLLIITNGVRTVIIPPESTKEGESPAEAQKPTIITSRELVLDPVGMYELRAGQIDSLRQLPEKGVGLVLVGRQTSGEAHIRIFDAVGKRIVDGPETDYADKVEERAKLQRELANVKNGQPWAAGSKRKLRAAVAAITGLPLRGANRFARYQRVVDVRHPSGATLKSFELNIDFEETEKDGLGVSEVEAEGNVLIEGKFEEEVFAVRGEKAIYSLSSALIRIPDRPRIESGANRLSGQTASINLEDPRKPALALDGEVRMEAVSPAPVDANAKKPKPDIRTVILAESFRYGQVAENVVFERSVVVTRSDGVTLKSEWLNAQVDAESDRIGRIEAKRNVIVEMKGENGTAVAKSGGAVIDEATGLVVLRKEDGKQPEIVQGENLLRGDEIELDFRNLEDLRMKAKGNTRLKAAQLGEDSTTPVELAADKFSYGGKILLAEGNAQLAFAMPSRTADKPAVPMKAWGQSIIVDQKLGVATLDTAVRVVDAGGIEINCKHLIVDIPETEGEALKLSDLTATGDVVMTTVKDGKTSRAKGQKAVYVAETGDLTLTGNCLLDYDGNQIFGDRIVTKMEREGEARLRAEGSARMEFMVVSEGEEKPFHVTADRIVLDEKTEKAHLLGSVRIKDDSGLDIRCGRVDLDMPKNPDKKTVGGTKEAQKRIPNFVATESVIARIPRETRMIEARCDRAVYVSKEDSLELLGNITGLIPEGNVTGKRSMKYYISEKRSVGSFERIKIGVGRIMESNRKKKQ